MEKYNSRIQKRTYPDAPVHYEQQKFRNFSPSLIFTGFSSSRYIRLLFFNLLASLHSCITFLAKISKAHSLLSLNSLQIALVRDKRAARNRYTAHRHFFFLFFFSRAQPPINTFLIIPGAANWSRKASGSSNYGQSGDNGGFSRQFDPPRSSSSSGTMVRRGVKKAGKISCAERASNLAKDVSEGESIYCSSSI